MNVHAEEPRTAYAYRRLHLHLPQETRREGRGWMSVAVALESPALCCCVPVATSGSGSKRAGSGRPVEAGEMKREESAAEKKCQKNTKNSTASAPEVLLFRVRAVSIDRKFPATNKQRTRVGPRWVSVDPHPHLPCRPTPVSFLGCSARHEREDNCQIPVACGLGVLRGRSDKLDEMLSSPARLLPF